MAASLTLGLEAHPEERTLTLLAVPRGGAPWVRPGVSAFLEVRSGDAEERSLAVPSSSVLQDGLTHVLFLRDATDPDHIWRLEADLGVDDGRWVEIKSGLALGDEVVVDGAYELKLAAQQQRSGGVSEPGGHVHADGTRHDH